MTYTLTNDLLTAHFKAEGAEMTQLTDKEGIHYIWNADARYWKRHTPILFPLVGKVVGNVYTFEGKEYTLGQHGFARDQVFEVTDQTATSITFTLKSSAVTHALYPFDFILDLVYTLDGNKLGITYRVTNTDTQTIAFKIGAHPAFMCPLLENEVMADYFLEFEKEEATNIMLLNKEGFFNYETLPFTGKHIALSPSAFERDALVFSGLNSNAITLRSHKNPHTIKVNFEGFTHLGIWSLATGAPFVCIEPWVGHADFEDEQSEWLLKKDLTQLKPAEVFVCTHTVSID